MINIIVAFTTKAFGIGKNNTLPWHIPEDLKHFADVTKDAVVIMGYKTWMSIPEDKKPLKNRINIVVSSTEVSSTDDAISSVKFVHPSALDQEIMYHHQRLLNIFIIGGASLYNKYMGVADKIYATFIDKDVQCDTFFPIQRFDTYEIESFGPLMHSQEENCKFRFVTYTKSDKKHDEHGYLQLLKNIMEDGIERPDRTGVGTKSMFAPNPLRFDISKSIPVYTTKFVGIKMVIKELLWFLRGQTDSKLLEQEGINIWKGNTTRDFLDARGLHDYREGDTGPLYSNLRIFGCDYKGCDVDHLGYGIDQVQNFIDGIKADPFSRRHLMTTYNPATVSQCVLYPCHGIVIQGHCESINGEMHLSMQVYIRSNDLFLGNAFNVTSYAVLTYIIAKYVDMKPRNLIITIGDAHIYQNHYEQVMTQLSRSPLPFPVLEVSDAIKSKKIEEISVEDFTLHCYLHHPTIKAQMAV
jgi:thymidylate synthase